MASDVALCHNSAFMRHEVDLPSLADRPPHFPAASLCAVAETFLPMTELHRAMYPSTVRFFTGERSVDTRQCFDKTDRVV